MSEIYNKAVIYDNRLKEQTGHNEHQASHTREMFYEYR